MKKELWFTVDVAANYLDVPTSTIYGWCQGRHLEARKDNKGRWRIPQSALDGVLKEDDDQAPLAVGDDEHFEEIGRIFAEHGLELETLCPRPCPALAKFVDRDCLTEGCFLEEVTG